MCIIHLYKCIILGKREEKVKHITIFKNPVLKNTKMIVSFTGWMDGGNVSTGTVEYLIHKLKAEKFAEIDAQSFYIFNLPGTMQQVAQLRPYARIQDGIVVNFGYPQNELFCDEKNNIIFLCAEEPNLSWAEYANCLLELAEKFDVKTICFAGSVGGLTPHTREVRVTCSCSNERQKEQLKTFDITFTNYEGPASIVTLLTELAKKKGIEMVNFVAEIPIYVQTENPKAIKALLVRLVKLLAIDIDLTELSERSNEFERNMNELVSKQPKLNEQIRKLEENYDKEFFDQQREDFDEWLKRHGIDKL